MTDVQTGATGTDGAANAAAAAANAGQQQTQTQGQQTQQTQTNTTQTVATGAQQTQPTQEKPYWPDDWREKIAQHASAGDAKIYEKELKRLQALADPTAVHSSWRSIENTWASRNFMKKPGKDAKPEEIAEFQKELGWTDKHDELLGGIKLENGAVLGDADKPVMAEFVKAVHGATSAQDFLGKAANWYFGNQEKQAAALDEADENFRNTAVSTLKQEFGPAFDRKRNNALSSLFAIAPGGNDAKNPKGLMSRLLAGRTADGRTIGDDPDILRWLIALGSDRNPVGAVVEDGDQSGKSLESELAAIRKRMREDRAGYFKDEKMQARYRELTGAGQKQQARQRA